MRVIGQDARVQVGAGERRSEVLSDEPGLIMDGLSEETFQAMTRATPLGRAAEPHEIAGTVVFLARDHAAFISGATINLTGGFLMS
jgi:NAD(P)-dependent dehydrogenase (short-subunit alcohol dehydrogenase family)